MAITKLDAIKSLHPTAELVMVEDEIKEWHSEEITQPTDAEITAEQNKLQTEYDNNAYQRNRAAEYPSIADQLDEIYHNGIDSWKAVIKTTKDKYPKP
jgi:hypothetical protein|tara:strand:+ start:379 stop:672 length:294 start_codon:yes stop_codon:yes gene_type:complete